ncbi:hypothetical protein PILCRDRAFT_502541 [Piloderma croceum F 1598]|uniref:Uncharacterized protein n=1 Tax=Piloderma croceum (strain F 1598) TaxID=765440 RepID=A0A0C3F937_PILCF|nr:hypothetical protein PILCRDRAFT_502541 [Piloderma croceum F 1598]
MWCGHEAVVVAGRRDSISFTGPSTNSEVSAAISTDVNIPPASTSTPELPTMSIKYRFTITYKDGKAARLVPGVISEKEVYSIFKADLKIFEIEQPKDQAIRLDGPGSISFAFMKYEDVNDNGLYNSCMMLEMTQHHDHQIALLKRERSM